MFLDDINENMMNYNRLENMKNIDQHVYTEIFEWNQYEKYVVVEKGDLILDLGCSKGYFYFKNSQLSINYIGVDGSIDCLKDFIENMSDEDVNNVRLINSVLFGNKSVIEFPSMFHDSKMNTVISMTFVDLVNIIGRKIDFLKFDIEGFERYFLSENLDLFKKYVKKFSGEYHFKSAYNVSNREQSLNILRGLKQDTDIDFKLFSLDGVDISEYFWNNTDFYTEIIISGYVKKQNVQG